MSGDAAICLRFKEAINARSLDGVARLLSPDHCFVDTAGRPVQGKAACLDAWKGFFEAFPDYRNVFDDVATHGDLVVIRGRSICAHPELGGPALWSARVEDGLVRGWRVYEDTPGNRRQLGLEAEPALWVVAGCLFEVSLPPGWGWVNPTPEVTLLGDERRGAAQHFRFRAEVPGDTELCFENGDSEHRVTVRIAPERMLREGVPTADEADRG